MIYIVLPAYNEEISLERLLLRIKSAMELRSFNYTVILVNDGSRDRTLEIAQRLCAALALQIVNHESNKGLGAALKSGLMKASSLSRDTDVIITMDADNTHTPDLIPSMLSMLGRGYDCVIASRYVSGGQEIGLSFHRTLLSRGASALLKTVFPIKGVKDYTCGYRAYSAAILKEALQCYGNMFVQEEGFTCMVEVLLKLRKLAAKFCEVPLILRYDYKAGASKMRVIRTIVRYFFLIVQTLATPRTAPFRHISSGRIITPPENSLRQTVVTNVTAKH